MNRDFVELTEDVSSSPLWNPDLAPTSLASRTWSTYHIAALWIGMSVVITTYTLASGLMQQGMTWWQALVTILLGNAIVLIPMILNAHAGTKYGVSFPGVVPRRVRREGRQRAGDPARDRRVRMVRHPDLDRRARAAGAAHGGVAGMGERARIDLDLVCDLLARAGRDHHSRSRRHQVARGVVGAAAARRRRAAAVVGDRQRRRLDAHPLRSAEAAAGQHAVLDAVPRGADRERRLLGDAQPQHSRLHALRADRNDRRRSARRSACRRR